MSKKQSPRFPTKESYTAAVMAELTSTELGLLNYTIYYHPLHCQYYEMFACGKYSECWDYLMKHRDSMTLANVPQKWLKQAKFSIKSAKELNLGKKDDSDE